MLNPRLKRYLVKRLIAVGVMLRWQMTHIAQHHSFSALRLWVGGLVAVIILTGLSSCTHPQSSDPSPSAPDELIEQATPPDSNSDTHEATVTDLNPQLLNSATQFGFDLFASVVESRGDENVLVSPISVAIALAMAQNGAAGDTQDAIANTLRLPDTDLESSNAFYQALLERTQSAQANGGDVQLAIANSLWGRDGVAFNPSFLNQVEETFEADINTLDFAKPDAPDIINQWISDKTQSRIPRLINDINPDEVLFLINAVYFNGPWTMVFNPDQTSDRPFTTLDGTEIEHPLMTQTGRFSYLSTNDVQAVQLPYGDDRRFRMVLWLPAEQHDWTEFLATLTANQWDTWLPQFKMSNGTVKLPKFSLNDSMSLNDVLRVMGMAIAFDPDQADFSNLSDVSTVISQVSHQTFIDVSETGTEAAASTSIGFAVTSAPIPTEPFQMVCDRPFAFGIYDAETNAFLFLGALLNPSA